MARFRLAGLLIGALVVWACSDDSSSGNGTGGAGGVAGTGGSAGTAGTSGASGTAGSGGSAGTGGMDAGSACMLPQSASLTMGMGSPVSSATLTYTPSSTDCMLASGDPMSDMGVQLLFVQMMGAATASVAIPDQSPVEFVQSSSGVVEPKRVGLLSYGSSVSVVMSDSTQSVLSGLLEVTFQMSMTDVTVTNIATPTSVDGGTMDSGSGMLPGVPLAPPQTVPLSGSPLGADICEGSGGRSVLAGGSGVCGVGVISNATLIQMGAGYDLFLGASWVAMGNFPIIQLVSSTSGTADTMGNVVQGIPANTMTSVVTDKFDMTFQVSGSDLTISSFTPK